MVDPAPPIPDAARLPPAPGVYRFRDQAGRVLYVGRAVSLRRRVLSYWGDLGDRRHHADGGPDHAGRGSGLRFGPRGRMAGAEPAPAAPPAVEPQPGRSGGRGLDQARESALTPGMTVVRESSRERLRAVPGRAGCATRCRPGQRAAIGHAADGQARDRPRQGPRARRLARGTGRPGPTIAAVLHRDRVTVAELRARTAARRAAGRASREVTHSSWAGQSATSARSSRGWARARLVRPPVVGTPWGTCR